MPPRRCRTQLSRPLAIQRSAAGLLRWMIVLAVGTATISAPYHVHDAGSTPPVEGGLLDAKLGNGTAVVNLPNSTCSDAPSANIRYLHGWWMAGSWSTVVAAGVFIARYCRHKPWWLTAHIQLMTIGSLGTAGFAAVAVAMVQPERQGLTVHHILGGVVGALTILQASAGKYVHELEKSQKSSTRGRAVGIIHRVQGKLLLATAAYQVYLGIDMLIEPLTPWFLGWTAAVSILFIFGEARLQLCPPKPPAREQGHDGDTASSCIVCISACAGQQAKALATHSARHSVEHTAPGSEPETQPTLELRSCELEVDVQKNEPRITGFSSPVPPSLAGSKNLSRVPPPLHAKGAKKVYREPPPLNGLERYT